MQPTIISEPKQSRHIILKIILTVVILGVIAGITFIVIQKVQYANKENDVKTELIKQNKLMKTSMKDNIFPSTLPGDVKTTDKVIINANVSLSGTTYCIEGKNKQDTKIVFHMDKGTAEDTPKKGSCSDTASVAPLVPANVAVGSISAGAVTLNWNETPYAASYTIQCATDQSFINDLKSKTTSDTSMTLSDLKGGVQYYCRVAASNSVGKSEWSPTVDALTNAISVVPKELKVTTNSSTSLHYSWKAVPGATSYILEYATDSNFMKDVIKVTTNTTSGDAIGLKPYTPYSFHVKAVTAQFDADHASFSEEVLGRTAK